MIKNMKRIIRLNNNSYNYKNICLIQIAYKINSNKNYKIFSKIKSIINNKLNLKTYIYLTIKKLDSL